MAVSQTNAVAIYSVICVAREKYIGCGLTQSLSGSYLAASVAYQSNHLNGISLRSHRETPENVRSERKHGVHLRRRRTPLAAA